MTNVYFNLNQREEMARNLWYKRSNTTGNSVSVDSSTDGGTTLAEYPGNHPVITQLSPRNHPLLDVIWKHVAMIFAVLVMSVGQMWGATITINSSTTTSDALFPVSAAPTQYEYSSNSNVAGWLLIDMATSSSITITNKTGATITAVIAEGVAQNNTNKTVNFTISDGTTTAETSSGSWNNRKSSSLTSKALNATNVGKLKCDAGQTYTITNKASGSYAAGVRFIITYTSTLPTALTNGATTSTTQAVSWTAPSTAPANGYLVAYSTSSTAPGNSVTSTTGSYTVAAIAAGTTSTTISGLSESTTYYWWVRSKNARGNSSWVAGSSFTTDAAPAGSTWYVKGGWNGWGTTDNLTGSGTELTATVNITTAGKYMFKIFDSTGSGTWWGNGGNIGCNVSGWTFESPGSDCTFFASETGNYTFTFNTSTKKLSVTYPTAQGKYYYKNTGSWGAVYVYRFKGGINNGWPGTQVVETETICGDEYYFTYADPGTTLIFDNNSSSQTGDMAASGNAGKYVAGTGSSWSAFPTYTVTYNGNGNTGGSVPTDASNPYACGSTVTVKGNTGSLVKTGYTFAGWNTDAGGGGTSYAAAATFTISANTTLYAQWEEDASYSVTYNANGATGSVPTDANTYANGEEVTVLGKNTLAKTNYGFAGWRTAASSGTWYVQGQTFEMGSANVNLYAQWVAEANMVSGTLYKAVDMKASAASATGQFRAGISANGIFEVLGVGVVNDEAGPMEYGSDSQTIDGTAFTQALHFKGTGSGSPSGSTLPTTRAIKFRVPAAGTLHLWVRAGKKIAIVKSGGSASAVGSSTDRTHETAAVTAGTYYLYATGTSVSLYGLQFVQSCTAPTGLTAASTTAKGTTFTITDGANTNDYEFYVVTSSGTPASNVTPTHTTTNKTLTITDCIAGTTYYAWVRSKCSESNKSDWVALTGNTFTTSTVSADYHLSNVNKTSGATSGIGGSTFTAVFAAVSGYSLPSPVVTIGGNSATSGTDYTWTAGTGTLTINANKINGDIDITMSSPASAPTNVAISGAYHYYPGETISLTATATGGNGPKTYQWYKGGTADGDAIDGATSATFSKTCVVGDAGSYYCKVTCGGSASTWSDGAGHDPYNVKIMQFVLKNNSSEEISRTALTKVDATHATVILHLTGGTTYKFRITDGCGNYFGNTGTMTNGNSTDWYMNADADCGMTTGLKTSNYTFNVTLGDLGNGMQVTAIYPGGDQAAGKIIYWDNSVLGWDAGDQWYRIGKSTHHNKTQMTLVPGTDNLYKVTTAEYNGFEYWHIANNQGDGDGNLFWTKGDAAKAITNAMEFEGAPVTLDAITVTPTNSHATGETSDNDNCEFYTHTTVSGMKTDAVTISSYSNGTITVNYVDTDGEDAMLTSGSANLAHTVILTSITAVPNTGYDAGAITINAGAYSANYVVTGATTIAATFSPHVYTITYKDQGDAAFSGTHVDSPNAHPTSHTYATATTLNSATKTGYTFGGWFTNSACTGDAVASLGATDYTANITLYAKWTVNNYDLTWNLGGGTTTSAGTGIASGVSVNTTSSVAYGTSLTTPTVTKANYTFSAWSPTVASTMPAEDVEYTATWTANQYSVTHSLTNMTTTSGATGSNAATYGTNYSAVLAADGGYTLPATITVTAGATDITANCTWNSSTGAVSIPGSYITGNITITAAGVVAGPSYTAPTSALDISAQTSVTAAGLITAYYATQSNYLSTNTDTLLLIPSDIYYNLGSGKKNTWATTNGSPSSTSADWSCPGGSVSFKGRTWWKSSGNINTLQVRSDRTLNIRITGCKTVSVLNAAASSTKYFVMEAYEYDDGYKSSDPDVSANNKSTSVTETSLSLNSSKEYVVVLRGNTEDNNKVYEIKFIAPSSGYTVSITADPDGYGTVSSSSVTSVASGTTLSTSTNTLSVGATNVTASATSASAEYTYAFSNWTKSDGTALPATVTADLSVYANFTRTANNYTLTWSSNGGSDLAGDYTSGSTAYGASITAPSDPTLSNYTFDGWKTNNDGTGTTAGSTMPAANTTYYAAWKQTVTLNTGSQGEGGNQTPYVYLNGTGVSNFTAHTASGYSLQGYYTAGSGGVKVLNADGTFAAANVTDYITSSKWSRTGAAPTLYAQWVASEDCSTSDFVIRKGDATEYQGCMESSSYNGTATSFTAGSPTTVGNAKMTISNYSDGAIKRPGSGNTFSIVIEPVSGYYLKSICWAGKVEDDETVSYYWDDNSASAITISPTTTSGTGVTYNAPSSTTTKFTASYTDDGDGSGGIWWRNVQVEVCAGGGTTYNVTYNGNDETGGTAPTDATNYSYGGTVTVKGNTGSLEKTNYTFAGWTTNNNGTGSSYEAGSTFSITANTTLYAKWTQAVTFDANTSNHGSTGGSATAVWNAAGLTGITHATPASGYKLLGYYTAPTSGTKVLNSDGSFAATAVDGYVTDGKWSRTGTAPTLYAQYESAGALTWNLVVNTDTTSLSTSTKTSAFTEISTSNMLNATLAGDLTYEKSKKSALTGKISTPASYDADDYVYVTFQVASGYKFTPSSIKVIAQPVTTGKDVKLSLTDGASHSLVSSSATSISGGSTQTVTLAGDGTYFTGTVTLKIYCYGATDKYRLGTPITIDGNVEATCATMPSYTSMSYTTTSFLPNADASGSPITIVGGDNIDTYQWKYNTVNDRTSGTNCGTNSASLTPLTNAGAATDVTRYYWCEMTNDDCGITIKSPAVAITVSAEKSDATVTWSNPGTVNYGGGGYTIRATVDQSVWNGDASDLIISAPAGIRMYNVTSGTDGSSRKYVEVNFDVQTSFDRATYTSTIPFTVSADATDTYNAISDDNNVSYSACAGAGEGSSYNIRMRKTVTKDGNYYHCANTDGWISPNISSSYSTAVAGTTMAKVFDTVASSNTQYVWVRTYHANIKKVRIYADFRANDMTVSNVYKHTDYFTANNKYLVDYTAVYNGDEENENTGTAAQGYVDITLDEVMAANDILLVKFNTSRVRPLGAVITESSSGSLATALSFASATVNKSQGDASFIQTATRDAAATTSLGAITYSSNNTSVATVNATTGEVMILGAGAATIKATLAASGCYQKAEATYTVNVAAVACTDVAGIVTTEDLGCGIRLTLSGYTEGATIAWYKDGAAITPAETGTTYTATSAGSYYAVTHNDCDKASNTVVLADKVVSAERIVEQWYIKNGRVTPDIALWSVGDGTNLSSVAWSPANETGLTAADFYLQDGVIYLKGKSPSSNDSGADIEYTLTLTVTNGCSPTEMSDASKQVTLIHQKNTDKHVLAFVVTGTEKGGFTAGITAAQTTSVELYNTIAANFDVMATNIYSTDDEKKLKEYYSQFDILCVTDYPNTGTKGVNKKSYVDALGSLIDIRPILTMEAFVSKLDNWKTKGISGTPQSPTTRQYSMLLQCKDHEIFAGTELTKVGEGEDEMYRVNMVDNTLEDYATLDATYGGGEHAEKSGYNYGGKPALQGFTFDATMADDGLLPLGTIDDGAGNDLEVGIERQTEMSARLMVLGINSYAMERLTDDGQTVVINALKYLMKKNEEEIADCSISFVGGAEGNETDWNTAANWKGGMMPDKTAREIRILAPVVITTGQMIHAQAPIKIAAEGRYNAGADIATGKITIAEGGALIVDGKIQAVTAPSYSKARATDADDIYINASNTAQGALIFDNEDGDTHAVVEMWNPSYWEVVDGKKKKYWSYVAVPIQEADIPNFFWYGFTYLYDETSGWIKKSDGTSLYPFQGIGASLQTGNMETFYGPLATTESQDITLTYTADKGQGMNLIGNSWTAPIQIANFEADDFGDATAEVWVFNTGHTNDGHTTVTDGSSGTTTAGQWQTIPIGIAGLNTYTGLKVIPAMQAFEVNTASETTLHLDYDRLVRAGRENLNEPMRAPRRGSAAKQIEATMRVRVSGELTHTDVYLLKDARFSDAFDNGWDGHYLSGDDRSAQLYAISEAEGELAFLAQPEIEGTQLGFAPSKKDTEYTFSFSYDGEEPLYLNDLKLKESTLIDAENTYLFTYEEGDAVNRFYISATPFEKPNIATGTETIGHPEKVQKVMYKDHIYIIRGGKVFDVVGKMVK